MTVPSDLRAAYDRILELNEFAKKQSARIAELEAELASCKSVDIPEVWVVQKNHGYSGYGTPERAFTSEKAAMQYAKERWYDYEITDVYLIHDVTNGEEPHGDKS